MNKDNLIEFAKEQSVVFPEDSAMGWYLRETLKMLQADGCEDAVSRQAVAEFLRNHANDFEDAKVRMAFKAASSLVKNADNVPPVTPTQNWIPVSERLPSVKNYQRKYLVTLKDKTVCDAMFTECDGEHWWNYNYDDVIAWMPLPEPYKEGKEE